MVLGLGMIIGPLWWQQHLSAAEARYQERLEVVTGFLVLSTVMFSILTTAKPFQILVGTTAYSAVLVVFMQVAATSRPQRIKFDISRFRYLARPCITYNDEIRVMKGGRS